MNQTQFDLYSGQSLSSNTIDSSDSSQEKKEIIYKLQDKVTNLLIDQKKNEKLSITQENLKKCLNKIEQYRNLNQELQQIQNIFYRALGISPKSDLETIRKSTSDIKSKLYVLKTIQEELNIPLNQNHDQNESILTAIQKIKDKDLENNRNISNMLRILGIFNNYSNVKNNESPAAFLLSEIQKIKEEVETLRMTVKNFNFQQNEICHMLDIDTIDENDSYTLHFRMKGAIKNIKNKLREGMSEVGSLFATDCSQKFDTPKIVKTAISDLQHSSSKLQSDLLESEEKLREANFKLQCFEKKNNQILKRFNCSSIEEISQNMEDLLAIMNCPSIDILRRSIYQMRDQNQSLKIQTDELNSQIQFLQINNQKLNEQSSKIQEQFACLRSKYNESEAKKIAYKDELKDMKNKLSSFKIEIKTISSERNNLRGQLTDKDEEIISLKEILQTEKGNVKIHFEELEDQILSLKGQIRRSQQEAESCSSDLQNLEKEHNSLQQNYKALKEEKQSFESEVETQKIQIQTLNKETNWKSDEIETLKATINNRKQKIQSLQNQIDELSIEQSNYKRKMNDMNNQIDTLQNEKSKLLIQLENEVKENQSLKQQNDQNKNKINQIESQNSQFKIEIDNLNQLKQELLNKNNEYQKQVSQLQIANTENEQNIQSMKFKIDQLQNDNNSLNSEKQTLQSQISSLKTQTESQRNENSELQKNLLQVQNENQKNKLELETKIQKLEIESQNQKNEIQSFDQMNKNLNKQIEESNSKINEISEANTNLKSQLNKHEIRFQNLLSPLNCENIEEIESKVSQLVAENSKLKSSNEENTKQISEMTQNQNNFCKMLGIDSNSSVNSISDSISDLLADNKKMYAENQNMKQQLTSISSMLNVEKSDDFSSVQKSINNLYDEIQRFETEKEKINSEANNLKQFNQKLCQIMNVNDTDSLIEAISSLQNIINQIKQILNVSDDQIVESIRNLHDSIQTVCEALNLDLKESWTDSVLLLNESFQESSELLGINNSNQLASAIQKVVSERDKFSSEIQQISSLFAIKPEQMKSNLVDAIKESVDHYNEDISKLKEQLKSLQKENSDFQLNFDKANISLKDAQHQSSSLIMQVEELQKQKEQFVQQTEQFQQKNDNLSQQLSQMSIQNSDLNSEVEVLQQKIDNLSQINEDLKKQNSSFEAESQSSIILEKQLTDIGHLLQIKPKENQSRNEAVFEAIESLIKSKNEFNEFKWKMNKLLKSKNGNNDANLDGESFLAESLREIETLIQLVTSLCKLFNVESTDLLQDAAKKNINLIRVISPLYDSYAKNDGNSSVDDPSKLQQIVQEARQAKQINDKVSSMLNLNEPTEIINSLKSIQNQLSELQIKDENKSKFVAQLREVLGIDSRNDEIQQIQKVIKEMKENSTESQKVISQLSNLFDCEANYVVDFAGSMYQTVKNCAAILDVDAKGSSLFSEIEKVTKEIKKQNASLMKEINDDKSVALQILGDVSKNRDNLVRDAIEKLKNDNSELVKQNEKLKKTQKENDSLNNELKDQITNFKANNRKLFEKFDLSSQKLSDESKFKEIIEKIEEFQQISKEYQKVTKKNKELSERLTSIENECVKNANQIKKSKSRIEDIDEALKYMKNHEVQINKLREIVELPDSQFSVVVEKVSQINDQLHSQNSANEKLKKENKLSKEKIDDFQSNEIKFKKLIEKQTNQIDSLKSDNKQKEQKIESLNSSLNKIIKALGDDNIQSVSFAIDAIEELKRKIKELNNELIKYKTASTVDNAFDKISTNEKQQLKFIKRKIIEQTQILNDTLEKLKMQFESRNQNKEDVIRILKDAESNNLRLLDLLDPSLASSSNPNPNTHIHIGNEYSLNPFARQNADIFRKKRYLDDSEKEEPNESLIKHKIAVAEKELIVQNKKIEFLKRSERQFTSKSIPFPLAQRIKKEQKTLF